MQPNPFHRAKRATPVLLFAWFGLTNMTTAQPTPDRDRDRRVLQKGTIRPDEYDHLRNHSSPLSALRRAAVLYSSQAFKHRGDGLQRIDETSDQSARRIAAKVQAL